MRQTGHFYNDINSMLQVIANHARGDKEFEREAYGELMTCYGNLMSKFNQKHRSRGEREAQNNSDVIDLYTASDKSRKSVRLRSAGEVDRKKRSKHS